MTLQADDAEEFLRKDIERVLTADILGKPCNAETLHIAVKAVNDVLPPYPPADDGFAVPTVAAA